MNTVIRISTKGRYMNVRQLVNAWQNRHRTSGAIHVADPHTLLLNADTSVEALEDLTWALRDSEYDVEIIWRDLLLA